MDLCDRLSLENTVFQAGMGGGISGAELACAVSNAGGLGTVGFDHPAGFENAIIQTRQRVNGRPFAANLLMPLVRRSHVDIVARHKVPIVSLFYGFDKAVIRAIKDAGAFLIYQIGSETEARRVVDAGADALIVQGTEAGGHVRGKQRLNELLPHIRTLYPKLPLIAAGGIWDRHSAAAAIALGADGVSVGTRFLMTHESGAHDDYKQRLIHARETIITTLFGLGWPAAPHRVVVNAAIQRWCSDSGQPATAIQAFNYLTQFGARYFPPGLSLKMAMAQHSNRPFFTPFPQNKAMQHPHPEALSDYAGECVRNISTLDSAASVVSELAAGC